MPVPHGPREQEIMQFLDERVFQPILASPNASPTLKNGVRYTIMRLRERNADGIIQYYWSAIVGTDPSIEFSARMRREGFSRFEETIDEFRDRFDPKNLRIRR